MRRVYVLADLAILRGADREANLDALTATLTRTWAAYHQANVTFGYTLFDSSCGIQHLSSYLQRVASDLSAF